MDAYKISVGVFLNNRISGVLGLIARDFAKTDAAALKFQRTLREIKYLGAAGLLIGGAGFAGLSMVGKMVDHAKEYAHQLALLNTAGMTHLEIVRATNAAWAASKRTPTSTAAENLAAVRELRMVFGNTSDAIQYMPTVQRIDAILSTLRGGSAQDEAYTVAKALEMRGAVKTPGEFTTQANLMTKAIVASGGKIGAQDFLSAFKYARTATAGWSDFFTYKILPTLIQEMKTGSGGGAGFGAISGPGNAIMSAFAAVVGGTVSQKALGLWQKLGMLDPTKEVWTRTHLLRGIKPGGIKGADIFQSDPRQWVDQFLIPALHAHGYNDPKKMREAIQYLFPNRTAGFLISQIATQGWKFKRDVPLIDQAAGLSAYRELLKTDPIMAQIALQKQWNNLLAIMGFQLMPVLLPLMIQFTTWLANMARWMDKNPSAAKALMYAFTGLSAAMAFSGTVLLLTAAFKGLRLMLGSIGLISAGAGAAGVGGAAGGGAIKTAGGAALGALGLPVAIVGGTLALAYAVPGTKLKEAINQPLRFSKEQEKLMAAGEARQAKARKEQLNEFRTFFDKVVNEIKGLSIYIDGKKLGQVVSSGIAKHSGAVAHAPTAFNPGLSRAQP
jgi:hypothetical protein